MSPPPSVDAVAQILGISGYKVRAPLRQILRCALQHEARLARALQDTTALLTLHGCIEADGASVCHFLIGNDLMHVQWYGMIQRALENQRSRQILSFVSVGPRANALGKPFPEPYRKIKVSGALDFISRSPDGSCACLLPDGAPRGWHKILA